jgi:hypothetical protein
MIRSMVHNFPSIDGYDQVMISHFTTLEVASPPFSRSSISQYFRALDQWLMNLFDRRLRSSLDFTFRGFGSPLTFVLLISEIMMVLDR